MSKWEEWKKNLGETRPWHLLDHSKQVDSPEVAEKRYAICLECPFLTELTKQCKKCGCFMQLKTKLAAAACPINKW